MLGVPILFGIIYLVYLRVSSITTGWFGEEEYRHSHPKLKMGLRMAGFAFLLLALPGPYVTEREASVPIMGREIYLLMDVSGSMNCTDVAPSRLEKSKRELKRLIAGLEGDKIGLILFTEYAYIQCPLTYDHKVLEILLDLAETEQFAQTGTNFRNALVMAMDRFMNVESSPISTRAIVMISDGEDFGDTYASLMDRLRHFNIKIFPVGVGTYEGGAIPQISEGKQVGMLTHNDGSTAYSRLIDKELKNIARIFDTPYYALTSRDENLKVLEAKLKDLDASPISQRRERVANNLYQLFLGFALLCFASSLFIMPIYAEQ